MARGQASDPRHRGEGGGPGRALTRRELLKTLALGGMAVGCGMLGACRRPHSGAAHSAGGSQAWRPPSPFRRDGVVVIVRGKGAVNSARKADRALVGRMLEAGLTRLVGVGDAVQAWRRLFGRDDIIGLKVNCLGAPTTHTHVEVALAAAEGLQGAGLPASNLVIFDRLTDELDRAGYPVNEGTGVRCYGTDRVGYDAEPTNAGEVGSCLSRIVSEHCTALVNLPLLKDHDLAGVSISLKNHFGSINNPNKLHLNQCSPYVADLNLVPAIREKQRLIVCDALEVTYDGGPTYCPATTERYDGLLMATDPVALDRVGWQIVEGLRAKAGLASLHAEGREPGYIMVAGDAQHRLGVADLARIEKIEVTLT